MDSILEGEFICSLAVWRASLYYFLIESLWETWRQYWLYVNRTNFFRSTHCEKKINKRLLHAACTCCRLVKRWPLKEMRLSRFFHNYIHNILFLVSY
jgi:hypothetical protein